MSIYWISELSLYVPKWLVSKSFGMKNWVSRRWFTISILLKNNLLIKFSFWKIIFQKFIIKKLFNLSINGEATKNLFWNGVSIFFPQILFLSQESTPLWLSAFTFRDTWEILLFRLKFVFFLFHVSKRRISGVRSLYTTGGHILGFFLVNIGILCLYLSTLVFQRLNREATSDRISLGKLWKIK